MKDLAVNVGSLWLAITCVAASVAMIFVEHALLEPSHRLGIQIVGTVFFGGIIGAFFRAVILRFSDKRAIAWVEPVRKMVTGCLVGAAVVLAVHAAATYGYAATSNRIFEAVAGTLKFVANLGIGAFFIDALLKRRLAAPLDT